MKELTRKHFILLHILLIPLFFITHNLFDFYLLADFNGIKSEAILWLILPIILISCFYFLFRNIFKAGLLTSAILLVIFFAPSLMAFAKSTKWLFYLSKYSVVLAVVGFLLVTLFIWLRKTKSNHLRVHQFLFYCFLILLLYEPIYWLTGGKQKIINKNRLILPAVPVLKNVSLKNDSLPDIYYLLFDELAASDVYDQLFKFDNSVNDSILQSLGFKVVNQTFGASNHTHTAMSSVLNMSYLPFELKQQIGFREMHALVANIQATPLVPYLERNGYRILNAGVFDLGNHQKLKSPDNWTLRSANEMITDQTLYQNMWNHLGWMIESKLPIAKSSDKKLLSDTALVNEAMAIIKNALADTTSKHKFLYAHFYLPHGPVKYDSNGKVMPWKSYADYRLQNENSVPYLSQVKYTFKLLIQLCKQIQQQNKRPAVIIVQGDHGTRQYDTSVFSKDLSFQPFSAYYFPDGDYSSIPDSLYMPNTFRLVLNKYFQQQLPLLQKRQYVLEAEKDELLFNR